MSEQESKPASGTPQSPKPASQPGPTPSGTKADKGASNKKDAARKTKDSDKTASGAAAARPGHNTTAPRRSRAGLWLALLALLVALLVGLAVAYLWQQQQQLRGTLQQQQSNAERSADTLRNDFSARATTLQRRADELGQGQQSLRESVESVRELAGRSRRDWILAEVEYLLRIANRRLQLQRDSGTAMAALESADARLRELADPGLTAVREQIARELVALRATPRPDIEGMAVQLSSLSERVEQLPVKAARAPARTMPEPSADEASLSVQDWRQGLAQAWQALKQLVVVRRRDQPIAPLLGPEQEFAVREGLRLQLNAARVALLRQDSQLFDTSVQGARSWLERYFIVDDPAAKAMADTLTQLSGQPVVAELPDISDSLRALRDIMQKRGLDTDAEAQTVPASAPETETPQNARDAAQPESTDQEASGNGAPAPSATTDSAPADPSGAAQ